MQAVVPDSQRVAWLLAVGLCETSAACAIEQEYPLQKLTDEITHEKQEEQCLPGTW